MRKKNSWRYGLTLIMIGCLSSCFGVPTHSPTSVPIDISIVQTSAVQTYVAEMTLQYPTETISPSQTATTSITSTATQTVTPTKSDSGAAIPAGELMKEYIVYYLINPIETESACRFSSIPILAYPLVKRTGDYTSGIEAALTVLFSNKSESYNGLLNPISKSNLRFSDLNVSGITINVYIEGTLHRYFEYPMAFEFSKFCPDSQTRNQIFKTVNQFHVDLAKNGITDIVVWFNRTALLDDLLLNDFPAQP